MAAQAPIFTASLQLSELGKAVPRIDLSPLSSLGKHFAQNFPTFPSPIVKTTGFVSRPSPKTIVASVEALGALVRSYREEFALSQQSFAERAGVGRRFISELENGKPSLEFDKVLAVARAAGIELFATRRTSSTP
jgi:y4mF family transcriptional regulator